MAPSREDVATILVAAQPTPGQGVALDLTGSLPLAVRKLLAGYEFTYDEFTVPVSTAATTEGTATTIKTATAVIFDGVTTVEIGFFCPELLLSANATGNFGVIVLYEDGVSIGWLGAFETSANETIGVPVKVTRRRKPTKGSHTYSVRAYHKNPSATFNAGVAGVGAWMPGFIRITKV